MNIIFFAIVLIAFVSAGWRQIHWLPASGMLSPMEGLTKAMVESAAGSVELALGLVGVMTLFLGLMKVAEAGGMLTILARLIRPLMVKLFPRVPPDHPAMGSMILNMSANALGLGNAATPFGIRAMQELDKLNSQPGTATDSMVLFLAINTSNVTILPTGVMAIRAAAGSTLIRPASCPRRCLRPCAPLSLPSLPQRPMDECPFSEKRARRKRRMREKRERRKTRGLEQWKKRTSGIHRAAILPG